MQPLKVLVEITGNYRQGTSKANKPFCMYEGYIHLGKQYPVRNEFYAQMPSEVPQAGVYECDLELDVIDGRLSVRIDARKGARKNLPPLSAAKTAAAV